MTLEKIFISHSHVDEALYSSLCLALDGAGVVRWDVAKLTPGKSLADALRSAIQECDACVFLATTRSLESRWCLAELGAFWGAGKKVIIYLADPAVDESQLPPQFRGNLWTKNAAQLLEGVKEHVAHRVERTANGFRLALGSMELQVTLGRIEQLDHSSSDCLVALPANEFFDDDCINDSGSALGAFMQHHFPGRVPEIQALVANALSGEPTQEVRKTPKSVATSYGVGQCVFLDRPLSSPLRIAMVSVTTQRADAGLHADASCVLTAVAALHRVMANNRLRRLHLPILGSGHGGMRAEVSLLCMLIALGEIARTSVYPVKAVELVVFKDTADAAASIPDQTIYRELDFASRFLGSSD